MRIVYSHGAKTGVEADVPDAVAFRLIREGAARAVTQPAASEPSGDDEVKPKSKNNKEADNG